MGPRTQKSGAPKGEGPEVWGPVGCGARNFALFFSVSGPHFLSFFPLLGVFSWNFGGVFEREQGPCASNKVQKSCPEVTVLEKSIDIEFKKWVHIN